MRPPHVLTCVFFFEFSRFSRFSRFSEIQGNSSSEDSSHTMEEEEEEKMDVLSLLKNITSGYYDCGPQKCIALKFEDETGHEVRK